MPFDTTAAPTVADLRAWKEITLRDDVSDDLLGLVLAEAIEDQTRACDFVSYGASLFIACLRRASRTLAAKPAELGIVDLGEFGQQRIARWDSEIERGERAYRRGGFA